MFFRQKNKDDILQSLAIEKKRIELMTHKNTLLSHLNKTLDIPTIITIINTIAIIESLMLSLKMTEYYFDNSTFIIVDKKLTMSDKNV